MSSDSFMKQIESLRWRNPDSIREIDNGFSRFGRPSYMVTGEGGHVCWDSKSLIATIYHSICIEDTYDIVKIGTQKFPGIWKVCIFYDFLASKYKEDLLSLAKKAPIVVDFQRKTLGVRGRTFAQCIAMLMVITGVGNGAPTLKVVESKGVLEKSIEKASEVENLKTFGYQLKINIDHSPGHTVVEKEKI